MKFILYLWAALYIAGIYLYGIYYLFIKKIKEVSMKKVLDINTFMVLINQKKDFYRKMGSRMYTLSIITILNAPLRTTIKLINDGELYYDEEEG